MQLKNQDTLEQRGRCLETVRILDLTRATSGPYGSLLLADLGAQVIKIEAPLNIGGVGSRQKLETKHLFHGEDFHFLSLNRNKKSFVIDLRPEKGKEVFYDLVKKSDVVLDNFRPGVTKRLGIDYETLSKITSKIICCSISGFGSYGPLSDKPAFDVIVQAIGGTVDLAGSRDSKGRPARPGTAWADLTGGMFAAYAISAALYDRERTGKGRMIDISMLDGLVSILSYMAAYQLNVGSFKAMDEGLIWGGFKTKDEYIFLAAHRENLWGDLCKALDREEWLTDPRFSSRSQRAKNKNELWEIIEEVLSTKTAKEWLEILPKYDVPSAPINTVAETLEEPQVKQRNMIISLEHPLGGQVRGVGNPIKMSGMEEVFELAPVFGQHTREILTDLLGYSLDRIEELEREDIVLSAKL